MAIEMSNLKPAHGSRHKYKRMGRGNGSGKGTTAGKGTKGQRARQGGRKGLRQIGMKRTVQSTPKLGGFAALTKKATTLPISVLNKFNVNDTITVSVLAKAGLIPHAADTVKLVDGGKLAKKINVRGISVSAEAKAKIEALGGAVVI
jgi:large subunit ribosomal protein L15